MQLLWWTTIKQMNISRFFFKWTTMIVKNISIMEFKTVTILKYMQKTLTRGPWAISLTRENSSNQQTHIIIILLIEKRKIPLFTLWESSIEQTWIPSPKDALCQIWLKLAQWFWRRFFFYFVNVFSLSRNYLPLEKGWTLHLNKLESSSQKDALCLIEIEPVVLEKKLFMFRQCISAS